MKIHTIKISILLLLINLSCKEIINYETFEIEKHAPTPPMGWNSWNNFGADITEAELKAQVDYIAENLKQYGYEYIVIDLGWYDPTGSGIGQTYKRAQPKLAMDEYGRLLPPSNRFPSCTNGSFKPIADYIHAKGLKFGIHIMRGIPWEAVALDLPIKGSKHSAGELINWDKTCVFYDGMRSMDMTKPGAQDYYNSIAQLYAEWEVDFIKADDMISYPGNYEEMKGLRYAMENCGRDMVLSLSPGHIGFWNRNMCQHFSEMYRVSGDAWDKWEHMTRAFKLADQFNDYSGPGGWADLDMLVLGYFGSRHEFSEKGRPSLLTKDEQFTHYVLWCMAKSPLMLGMDVTKLDEFTTSLLSNKTLLKINQEGINNKQIENKDGIIIWQSELENQSTRYRAIFNTNDKSVEYTIKVPDETKIIDILNDTATSVSQQKNQLIPAHGVLLLKVEN